MKLSAEDTACPLKVMVSVNNPFDITTNNNVMRATLYEHYLVRATVKNVVIPDYRSTLGQEKHVFAEMQNKFNLDYERLKHASTWRELDEHFTRKVQSEFKSAVGYYNAASCLNSVQRICVPTLVIHSADDLITPLQLVPIEELS